jgi:hypothetical protein
VSAYVPGEHVDQELRLDGQHADEPGVGAREHAVAVGRQPRDGAVLRGERVLVLVRGCDMIERYTVV